MKLKFGIVLFVLSFCFTQVAKSETDNPCITMKTCGKCIQSHPDCVWCSQEDFRYNGGNRCDYFRNLRGKCEDQDVVYPENRIYKLKDAPLSDRNFPEAEVVLMKPQEIKLKLRPHSVYPLNVEFRQVQDFPIDVYYLIDMSSSMKEHKEKLKELGKELDEVMQHITTNYRLGIGSFMGKSHENPQQVSYEFQNHMSLSSEKHTISHDVLPEIRVSDNQNATGSGFSAIIQAMTCTFEIGWREMSRKIIVFVSDSVPFYAGDGKGHGTDTPSDGYCHLDYNGRMENSLQDYPSLTQINHQIRRHKINIIFAVTDGQVPNYHRISEQLEGSAVVKLEDNPSDVVNAVREIYDKITTSVQMRDQAPSQIRVTYLSRCLSGGEERETNICKGLRIDDSVKFRVNIEVTTCPENREEWIQTFSIYPVGIKEQLLVHLEMICECECEKSKYREEDSPRCPGRNNSYECGVCTNTLQCYEDHLEEKNCYPNDVFDGLPCSGRGMCICGRCLCDKRNNPEEIIVGDFCECDNFSCDRRLNGNWCSECPSPVEYEVYEASPWITILGAIWDSVL